MRSTIRSRVLDPRRIGPPKGDDEDGTLSKVTKGVVALQTAGTASDRTSEGREGVLEARKSDDKSRGTVNGSARGLEGKADAYVPLAFAPQSTLRPSRSQQTLDTRPSTVREPAKNARRQPKTPSVSRSRSVSGDR